MVLIDKFLNPCYPSAIKKIDRLAISSKIPFTQKGGRFYEVNVLRYLNL